MRGTRLSGGSMPSRTHSSSAISSARARPPGCIRYGPASVLGGHRVGLGDTVVQEKPGAAPDMDVHPVANPLALLILVEALVQEVPHIARCLWHPLAQPRSDPGDRVGVPGFIFA